MPSKERPFEVFNPYLDQKLKSEKMDEFTAALLKAAQTVNDQINDEDKLNIRSCNLPTQGKENKGDVFVVQGLVDKIMKKDKSLLDRMREAAVTVETFGAGNCQHKTFLALKLLLDHLIYNNLANYNQTPSLEILYSDSKDNTDGHFFIRINKSVICDPWAQAVYPAKWLDEVIESKFGQEIFEGEIRSFFYIDTKWHCYKAEEEFSELSYDKESTNSTLNLFEKKVEKREREESNDMRIEGEEKDEIKEPNTKKFKK